MKIRTTLLFCILLLAAACGMKSPYYQKQQPVPGAQWSYGFQPSFKIDVSDTTGKYRFYFLMRHDEAYPNANLWFRMKIKGPEEKTFTEGPRIEVMLADAGGKWLGTGMGGIWEHKIPLQREESPRFGRPGTYEIKVEQLMRQSPLPSVLNVGLCIEKLDALPSSSEQ